MSRTGWTALVLGGLAVAGVSCVALLPKRFAVNAPIGHMLFGWGAAAPAPAVFDGRIRVPEGFSLGLYAEGIPGARMLRFSETGDLLVSLPRSGEIRLLERDRDGDGRADGVRKLMTHLRAPHGLDLHEGRLYVAETDAVGRIFYEAEDGRVVGNYERVVTDLPTGGNHWTRTVRIGPDGRMYVTVGSSCNACIEDDRRRAAMLRFAPDGSEPEIFADGLRNSVDFDWRPGTGELYATDNGRDLLGDDFPPCELNRIEAGGFYGWPFANGDRVPDPDLGPGNEEIVEKSIPPVHGFGAHTAPLGIAFLRDPRWGPEYRGAAVVALHGSWNRTRKIGYEVVSLHWRADGTIEERHLLTGLEVDEHVIGRPTGVAEGPDGAIYVADDFAGVVYRIAPPFAARGKPARAEPERSGGGRSRLDPARIAAPTPPMPVADLDAAGRRDLAAFLLHQEGGFAGEP